MKLHIARLNAEVPVAICDALDRILVRARRGLVGPGEWLEPVSARIAEAEGDEGRLILFAMEPEGAAVGLVDAHLHHPSPNDLTVAHLAVAEGSRHRGVGRRLFESLMAEAELRIGRADRVYAAVRSPASPAASFWARLGFEEDDRSQMMVRVSGPAPE